MENKEFLEDGVTPNPDFKKEEDNGGDDKKTSKTFTEEQHQAELDRVAAKTREEEKKKSQKAIDDAVKKATEEAQRLQKRSEVEREKELQDKKNKEFEDREKNVTLRENKAIAIEKLSELKLPTKLVDFVIDLDPETQDSKITNLHEAFNAAVAEGVAATVKGNAPPDPTKSGNSNDKAVEPTNFI